MRPDSGHCCKCLTLSGRRWCRGLRPSPVINSRRRYRKLLVADSFTVKSRESRRSETACCSNRRKRGESNERRQLETSTTPCGLVQRFGLDVFRPLTPQERFRLSAALRIRSDSSIEHLRSIVVLGPRGRAGVLERLRFNSRNLTAFAHSVSSKSTNLMTMFSI